MKDNNEIDIHGSDLNGTEMAQIFREYIEEDLQMSHVTDRAIESFLFFSTKSTIEALKRGLEEHESLKEEFKYETQP